MTNTIADLNALRGALTGTLLTPTDGDYEPARAMWNAAVDRLPAAIARCATTTDVVTGLAYAAEHRLDVAVRGGGHNAAGTGTCDGGLVLDLGSMNAVTVDPQTRLVRCGGGARLADLDAATAEHGLAVPVGMVSETGIGGLALGGGLGWLTRRDGLTVDHLVEAEVVLADRRVVRASADAHADLFWALRGGGGNFGVVTEFVFRATSLPRLVQLGLTFHALDQGPALLRLVRDVMPGLSRDIGLAVIGVNAPPAPFVPAEHQLQPGFALVHLGFGDVAEHAAAVERARTDLPPLWELTTPMPYAAVQAMFDDGLPAGNSVYERAVYLSELTDDIIAVIVDEVAAKPTSLTQVVIDTLGGAFAEIDDAATAFGGSRAAQYALFAVAAQAGRADVGPARAWVQGFADALAPATLGNYVNGITEAVAADVGRVYGATKLQRLQAVKALYDPNNIFRRNINIAPR